MKTIILTKEQMCYRENLNPKDFKTVEELSRFLLSRDRQEKEQKLRELVEFQNK